MRHGKQHQYLYFLCRKHGVSLEELYHDHRELLSINLRFELFRLIREKEDRRQGWKNGGG
ncbi:hypothetical protein AYK25_04340 [Thermoplasmatales archaeon SM1-50]|nr:MAG: hypothetical protein AYK25_04340 [Thermoplasmatales archaeon SM1-50]